MIKKANFAELSFQKEETQENVYPKIGNTANETRQCDQSRSTPNILSIAPNCTYIGIIWYNSKIVNKLLLSYLDILVSSKTQCSMKELRSSVGGGDISHKN